MQLCKNSRIRQYFYFDLQFILRKIHRLLDFLLVCSAHRLAHNPLIQVKWKFILLLYECIEPRNAEELIEADFHLRKKTHTLAHMFTKNPKRQQHKERQQPLEA